MEQYFSAKLSLLMTTAMRRPSWMLPSAATAPMTYPVA